MASVPYMRDALKGKSKPNLATWSTWSLLNAIIVVSALAAGDAINTVVMGAAFFIGSTTILLIAIFKGTRKYTLFDGACQAFALLGVVLWQLSNNPNIALLFVILVDFFAIAPTFRHAYLHPHEETWITYAVSGLLAFVLTAMATSLSFASLAVTIESGVINLLLTGVIISRASRQSIKANQ